MIQNRVIKHGAQDTGTKRGSPRGNHGPNSTHPAKNVGPGNATRHAFPTTGGRRSDKMGY